MKYSTATSVLQNFSLEDAIETVSEIGFDAIDAWCGRPHLFRRDYSQEQVIALGRRIGEEKLAIASVMPAFFRYPFSLASPMETIGADSVAYMKDCIDNAVLMGAKSVLIVPTTNLLKQTPAQARAIFLNNIGPVCEYAQEKGILLGLEVLNNKISSFVHKTQHALDLIRDLQCDQVGIVLDTGHINLSEESFEAAFDLAGEKLMQIHINDNNGKEQQNAIPGTGNFDFAAMGKVLCHENYTGFLSLELGGQYAADPVPALQAALTAAKRLIG